MEYHVPLILNRSITMYLPKRYWDSLYKTDPSRSYILLHPGVAEQVICLGSYLYGYFRVTLWLLYLYIMDILHDRPKLGCRFHVWINVNVNGIPCIWVNTMNTAWKKVGSIQFIILCLATFNWCVISNCIVDVHFE